MKSPSETPIDLTTLGGVGEMPPKGHPIYKHQEAPPAPSKQDVPLRVANIEVQIIELKKSLDVFRKDILRRLQLIEQRMTQNG